MQQHSPNEKRKRIALRYFTYGVMSLAVVAISALCILLALGYRFDYSHQTVVQGGLIQYRSFPTNATITLDGQVLSFKTPGKSNVEHGQHKVIMNRDKYREWSKTMTLDAGELRWLNYARLIPSTVTTTPIREFKTATSSLPSADRKWMAVWGAADQPELTMADLRNPEKYAFETFPIPAGTYAAAPGKPHDFRLMEWDFGGRFLLVKHTNGDTVEFLRLDRTKPGEVLNITTKLNLSISTAHFSGNSGNILYVQDRTDLRRVDVGAGTISSPIVGGLGDFLLYKTDTLVFTSDKDAKRRVGVSPDGKTVHTVREYDTTQPVLADVSEYFSDMYLAVARGTSVEIIKNPADKTSVAQSHVTFTLPISATWLQFSNNGRFIVAGSGTQFVTYDLETKETFSVNLPGTMADPTKPLQWLDDYIMVASADNNLRLSEFDGANQQVITDVEPGFPVTLTEDGEALVSIAKSTNGFILQSSNMIVK